MASEPLPANVKIFIDSEYTGTQNAVRVRDKVWMSPATAFRYYMGETITTLDFTSCVDALKCPINFMVSKPPEERARQEPIPVIVPPFNTGPV